MRRFKHILAVALSEIGYSYGVVFGMVVPHPRHPIREPAGPPPGHPERLSPAPPTEAERELIPTLRAVSGRAWPRG
jgi:hypothetical protein